MVELARDHGVLSGGSGDGPTAAEAVRWAVAAVTDAGAAPEPGSREAADAGAGRATAPDPADTEPEPEVEAGAEAGGEPEGRAAADAESGRATVPGPGPLPADAHAERSGAGQGADPRRASASRFLDALADRLALGVASVVALLDPGCVVLGGEVGQAGGDELAVRVAERIGRMAPLPAEVRPSVLGGGAVLRGALLTAQDGAQDELFAPPER